MASHLPEASPPGAIACRRGVRFHVDRGHGRPRAQCFPSSGCLQVQYFHQRPISTHLQRSVECLAGAATKHREGRTRARGGACSGRRAGHVPCGLPRSHRGSRRAEENAIGWTNTLAGSRFRHGPTQAGGRGTPPRGDPETQAPSAMLPLKQVLQGPTAESRDSPARPTARPGARRFRPWPRGAVPSHVFRRAEGTARAVTQQSPAAARVPRIHVPQP